MGEAETIPVDLEDVRLERLGQSGFCPPAGGDLDEAHRRVGERGNDSGNRDPGSFEPVSAISVTMPRTIAKNSVRAGTSSSMWSPMPARPTPAHP